MKLLFVSVSGRISFDENGKAYLNSHMNEKVIKRYYDLCEDLTVILRDNNEIISSEDAKEKYNSFPNEYARLIVCSNPYKPITNLLSFGIRKMIRTTIEKSVKSVDRVIIGQSTGVYANETIRICKKYKIPYLVLVGGFSFECDWYNSFKGKFVALYRELIARKNIYQADYVLYVTEKSLQERYKTQGRSLGCSDVEIYDISEQQLNSRLQNLPKNKEIIIGTAAGIDLKLKGLSLIIKAIGTMKEEDKKRYKIELVGAGSGKKLKKLAKRYKIEDRISFVGSLEHAEMVHWYDKIDIYIQPSYTEGLSRSIVEAMSRACPVICTETGGNVELGNPEYMFKPGDSKQLRKKILEMSIVDNMKKESITSFLKSKEFECSILDEKRNKFFEDFMEQK